MKKFTTLFFLIYAINVSSQATIFSANFANLTGNNAWTANNAGEWIISGNNSFAGGGGAKYMYSKQTTSLTPNNYNEAVTSPVIDLTGKERLTLEFKLYSKINLTAGDIDRLLLDYETNDIPTILNGNSSALKWFTLGRTTAKEVLATNWYNTTLTLGPLPTFYWKRNDGGWIDCKIELPSQAFDNKASIRFRYILTTDGSNQSTGVAIDDFIIKGYNIAAKTYLEATCSATLFDNLEGWWKPESLSGTYTNGQSITNWPNSSNILNNWTDLKQATVGFQPKFTDTPADNINFNPVVKFDGVDDFLIARQGFYNDEIFIVLKTTDPIQKGTSRVDILMGESFEKDGGNQDVTGISVNETSARYTPNNDFVAYNQGTKAEYGRALLHPTLKYDRPVVFNTKINAATTGQDLLLDAINLAAAPFPATLSSEVNTNTYHKIINSKNILGRSNYFDASGFLKGQVAEILIFSATKSAADKDIINSYLAIKYGANLGLHPNASAGVPHVPYPYKNSAGQFLFLGQTAAHPDFGFTYNICAIGRDDCLGLNQKQSYSVDPETYVTVGLGDIYSKNSLNPNTFANDKDFLIWGSTIEDLANPTTDLALNLGPAVTTFTSVTNRTWKFKEIKGAATSDIGNVKLQIETAGLLIPITGPEDAIVMIVSDSKNFNAATDNIETVFMTQNGIYQQCNYDFDGTKFVKFGIAHETLSPLHMEFDGDNDKLQIGNNINLNSNFTISSWVNTSGNNIGNTSKMIVSKFNSSINDGYSLSLNNLNKVVFTNKKAAAITQIVSNTTLPINQWRYVTVTYDGTNLKIYIDGVLDKTSGMTIPNTNNHIFSVGCNYIDKLTILDVFKGKLDELRVFNTALSINEIRYVMNQELEKNGTQIKGKELPLSITKNDIGSKTWASLQLYYNFNSYLGTHINDLSNNKFRASLVDRTGYLIQTQTAPLPYITSSNGNGMTAGCWNGGTELYLPNENLVINGVSTEITWNIIKTKNDLTFNKADNKLNVLALLNESNKISVENNSKLEVSHYLKLNGVIDLVEQSQLVQPLNSDLEVTSSGNLERDIKSQLKLYNYNILSSPVSTINTTSNNSGYVLNNNLFNATDVNNIQTINWTNSYYGSITPTFLVSRRWLYKYNDSAEAYANWVSINENSALAAADGFTMKGVGTTNGTQTYTFKGKPNNGNITRSVSANNIILLGNPYPSTININQFILNNNVNTTGTLYFWEQSSLNNSHVLAEYLAGYATRNLVGGVAPVAPPGISGLGGNTKTPKLYIPVGQGFFIKGSATGGNIVFNNTMRHFAKDTDLDSNTLFRGNYTQIQERLKEDKFTKLRFEIKLPEGNKREILVGFMDELATSAFDNGYDALVLDNFKSDVAFKQDVNLLSIQGLGNFDKSVKLPLVVKSKVSGKMNFSLTEKLNFNDNDKIYLHDTVSDLYYDLSKENTELDIESGEFDSRYEITFETNQKENIEISNSIVFYNNGKLNVSNTDSNNSIKKITVIDILGKKVYETEIKEQTSVYEFNLNIATGAYITIIESTKGLKSHKIIAN